MEISVNKREFVHSLCTVLVLLFTSLSSFGQETSWRLGIKNVPEFTTITGSEDYGSRLSNFGGVQLIYQFASKTSFESGFYYLDKGFKTHLNHLNLPGDPVPGLKESYKVKLHFYYLSLPLLFRYHFNNHWYALAGPTVDFFLCGKKDSELTGETKIRKDYLRGINLAAIAAFGYQFNISMNGKWKGFIEGRFNPVLTRHLNRENERFLSYGLGVGLNYKLE